MNKIMYGIRWSGEDELHVDVYPITVTYEGCLPGCTRPAIIAIDPDGRIFNGDPKNFFTTEQEAWASAKKELIETYRNYEVEIDRLYNKRYAIKVCLDQMGSEPLQTFKVKTKFIFPGTFSVKATSMEEARAAVLQNCSMVIFPGCIQSSLPDTIIDWDFNSHPEKLLE